MDSSLCSSCNLFVLVVGLLEAVRLRAPCDVPEDWPTSNSTAFSNWLDIFCVRKGYNQIAILAILPLKIQYVFHRRKNTSCTSRDFAVAAVLHQKGNQTSPARWLAKISTMEKHALTKHFLYFAYWRVS